MSRTHKGNSPRQKHFDKRHKALQGRRRSAKQNYKGHNGAAEDRCNICGDPLSQCCCD